jgi:hypothetical protein
MSSFEFCEHSHPFGGRSDASSGFQLGKEVDLKLCTRGGLRGTPLGLLPPLGERGGHPHINRRLPNNSKIKDFYGAEFFFNICNTVLYYHIHRLSLPG